jgi:hypothetical protein
VERQDNLQEFISRGLPRIRNEQLGMKRFASEQDLPCADGTIGWRLDADEIARYPGSSDGYRSCTCSVVVKYSGPRGSTQFAAGR